VPKLLGVLLVVNGLGWLITNLQPFLYPHARLDFLFVTYLGELAFMGWLLVAGRRVPG